MVKVKEIRRDDAPSQSQPRLPRRRRLTNPAKAIGALAGIALVALLAVAGVLHQAWSRPMPLKHRVVTTVSALTIPAGQREVVGLPGHSDPSHISIQTNVVYAGSLVEISAFTDLPLALHLPSTATIVGPAGPTINFASTQTPQLAQMIWRASLPTVATPTVATPTQGTVAYASWYIEFSQPGHFAIPVSIGASTAMAHIDVLALPPGGKVSAHMVPATALHPTLEVQDAGSTPAPVVMGGVARTLAPGQSVTVHPGTTYIVSFTPTTASSIAESVFQSHGKVSYAGTITSHRRISFRLPHPRFELPLWWDIALVLAALLLAVSLVAGLTGGRGGRGRGGKGPGTEGDGTSGDGTAGPKGTGANAS